MDTLIAQLTFKTFNFVSYSIMFIVVSNGFHMFSNSNLGPSRQIVGLFTVLGGESGSSGSPCDARSTVCPAKELVFLVFSYIIKLSPFAPLSIDNHLPRLFDIQIIAVVWFSLRSVVYIGPLSR